MDQLINKQDAIDVVDVVRQYFIDHHIEDGIYHANGIEAIINASDMSTTLNTTPGGRRNAKMYETANSSNSQFINKIRAPQGEFEINLSDNVKKILFEEFMQSLSEVPVLEHKCNSCGGTIELNADKHIFTCPYCGRTYAIGTTMINDRG